MNNTGRAAYIAEEEPFARMMNTSLVSAEPNRVVVRMPYQAAFGDNRVHGGAISALVDIAATAAFWSEPSLTDNAQGATVGFDIHYLSMAVGTDLDAEATVRRRGGSVSLGEVTVRCAPSKGAAKDSIEVQGKEIACATVTYKLTDKPADGVRG